MKEQFRGHSELQHASEFIHFACTSEDANNVAQATTSFLLVSRFYRHPFIAGSHDIGLSF
jgi:hypothetical protein